MIEITKVGESEDGDMYEVKVDSKQLFGFICGGDKLSIILMKAANAAAQYEQLNDIVGVR